MKATVEVLLVFLLAGTASGLATGFAGSQGPSGAPQEYRGYPGDRYEDYGSPGAEVGFFYEELSPFGDWIYTYEYGWAWLPHDVPFGWRPYSYGRWVPSEYGWLWVSYEPFGWATYHYGRWALDPRYGWIWTPGRVWGPAWVAWQSGRGYVGWAPLPPEVGFELGIGLRLGGLDLNLLVRPASYTFVEERLFLEPELQRYALPTARNVTIIHNTTNITNYTYVDNRVINRGIEVQRVERATGRRVRPVRVAETQTRMAERVRGDEVTIYRPPRQRLDSVRVDESKPRRGRGEPGPSGAERGQPGARRDRSGDSGAPDLVVAPRVKPGRRETDEQVVRKQREENRQLEAFERAERQRLDKLQRSERERKAPQGDSEPIAKRHAEEKQALGEELQRAKRQLEARQEVERKAVKGTPPPGARKADDEKATAGKAADRKSVDKKAAEKKAAEKKKSGQKKGGEKSDATKPPPPPDR